MGWTGIPCGARPNNKELNALIKDRIESPSCRIIDRSAWLDFGKRQFLLMEADSRDGQYPSQRFIIMITVEYRQFHLLYRDDEESMGLGKPDCPMRIMRKLEGHPPTGEHSAAWRDRVVIANHARNKLTGTILRTLDNQLPEGDRHLILNAGKQITYNQTSFRGRMVPIYSDPKTGSLHILKPHMIDPYGTNAPRKPPTDQVKAG